MVRVMLPFMLFLFSGYLGYHAFFGSRGYLALQEKRCSCMRLQEQYAALTAAREELQNRVSLVQEDIDPDWLEQYAWLLFRYVRPEKRVMLYR